MLSTRLCPRTTNLVAGSALAVLLSVHTGQPAQASSMQDLVKAAAAEGSVSFIESGGFSDQNFIEAVEAGIKEKYGIAIRINGTSGPNMSKMVSRLIQERQANRKPSVDLIRLSTRQRVRLLDTGVTEAVDWRGYDQSIRQEEITKDGSGLIVAARNVVIVYNTEKVPANMVPKTIEDLADPKYKGMIGTTPYGTGWGEIGLIFGQDYAFELAKKIAPNIAGYTGSSAFEPVITGQLPIFAFTTNGDMARAMSSRGAPLGIVTPFIAYLMGSVNMIKGAANPNAARLFTIFLRTPEGQKILRTVRREDSPFVEGSNAYQTVADARAAGKRVLLYTEDDVIKNSDIFEKIVPKINRAFKAQGR